MANPQLETGYAQISNEILEAFARTPSLGSEAFQVLSLVLRYTYGFHRKQAEMSISFIAKGTGLGKRSASRAIERLVSKRLVVRSQSSMVFNKNYDEWLVSKRTGSVQSDRGGVSKRRSQVVSNRTDKKDRLKIKNKNILTKVSRATPSKYLDGTKIILIKDEVMNPHDDRDRTFPRKRTWGDEKIDWTLDYLEYKLGRQLTGQEKWNRVYARHLTNKFGLTQVKILIDWLGDPTNWWFDKVGQVSTIYKHAEKMFSQINAPEPIKKKTIKELTIKA